MLKGFRDFILRGNVVDLAVAVIIGAAFSSIVTSLVNDVLKQFIAAIVGKPLLIYFSLRTPDDLPGQLDANATARQPTTALGQLGSFARWDRTLHVVR